MKSTILVMATVSALGSFNTVMISYMSYEPVEQRKAPVKPYSAPWHGPKDMHYKLLNKATRQYCGGIKPDSFTSMGYTAVIMCNGKKYKIN